MNKITYTPEIADKICERLASGESLNGICKDRHMPTEAAVRKWVLEHRDGFSTKYTRARELQADCLAEGNIDIADSLIDCTGNYVLDVANTTSCRSMPN